MATSSKTETLAGNLLRDLVDAAAASGEQGRYHVFRGHRCDTDDRGFSTPRNRDLFDLRVHSSEGFIPLWSPNTILRWRFRDQSFVDVKHKAAAREAIKRLLGKAMELWGDAAPVKLTERDDAWDFEIVVKQHGDCNSSGCVLASAFFPDAGRHELVVYPEMFDQVEDEQIETMAHELGHVFGLRHFFANISETAWPSEVFGTSTKFTIMNYGPDSRLTDADREDLRRLYRGVWDGTLREINGTRIQLVEPFHMTGQPSAMKQLFVIGERT